MIENFDRDRLAHIAEKIMHGSETAVERAYFDCWYQHFNDEMLEVPETHYARNESSLRERVWAGVRLSRSKKFGSSRGFSTYEFSLAASLALFLCVGAIYLARQVTDLSNQRSTQVITQDIYAARQGATLTLSDGKTLSLKQHVKGNIEDQDGNPIFLGENKVVYTEPTSQENQPSSEHTLTTAKGQTYQLTLPDGTQVWLNAESQIRYKPTFPSKGQRHVELHGEAYFEVAPDKKRPFVIRTKSQIIEVLGTKFNVRAYNNEPMHKTSLMEGKVQVATSQNMMFQELIPGQAALFDGRKQHIIDTDTQEDLAWKEGDFTFQGNDFNLLLKELERWYQVEFVFQPSTVESVKITGRFSRNKHLFSILNVLEASTGLQFQRHENKIFVTRSTSGEWR